MVVLLPLLNLSMHTAAVSVPDPLPLNPVLLRLRPSAAPAGREQLPSTWDVAGLPREG